MNRAVTVCQGRDSGLRARCQLGVPVAELALNQQIALAAVGGVDHQKDVVVGAGFITYLHGSPGQHPVMPPRLVHSVSPQPQRPLQPGLRWPGARQAENSCLLGRLRSATTMQAGAGSLTDTSVIMAE